MINFNNCKNSFNKTINFFENLRETVDVNYSNAKVLAEKCTEKLKEMTPKDTGLTAESWYYEIKKNLTKTEIIFYNRNIQNGLNVALLLEYGHGSANGSWIEGKDYIAPIIQQAYLESIEEIWRRVKNS